MLIKVIAAKAETFVCDTLIIGIPEGMSLLPQATPIQELDDALGGKISTLLQEQPSCRQFGVITVIHTFGSIAAKQIVLVGLGDLTKLTSNQLRAASAIAARATGKLSAKTASLLLQQDTSKLGFTDAWLQPIAEGISLGLYEFNHYKSIKKPCLLDTLYVVISHEQDYNSLQNVVTKASIITDSVCFARDLVNHPSMYMTPTRMAEHAAEIAEELGLELELLQADSIRERGLQALWAVAKGSDEPPVLIVLTYRGDPGNSELLGLVGKGITFDSGGISIKPSEGMGEMKDDMGGAATVLATMSAIGRLKPKANVIAVIPCAENMPSGRALKPGDVIGSLQGKTIEIITTDAEGRLVLADALTFARRLGATRLIDLATLTGACVVALGKITSAVITNDDKWVNRILAAAEVAGEKMWQLPAFDEYKDQIKSDIADVKNSGGRPAGAITAGLFLAEFAGDTPWAHIDIAGTVTSEKEIGYNGKGATGVAVRTLIQLVETE